MEQLSLPYRIALAGLLVFGVLYLLVLKPGDDAAPSAGPVATAAAGPTAPGVKGLATAVDKAKGAAATQEASDAATQAATGDTPAAAAVGAPATSGTAAATTSAAPAADTADSSGDAGDPSGAILAGVGRGHTAVVLFTGRHAADDRAVRAAVRRVNRRGGKVDIHVVPLARVGRYEAITRGVKVLQAPTVLVIGKQKKARTIVGFTTTAELNQLVGDVRRSG